MTPANDSRSRGSAGGERFLVVAPIWDLAAIWLAAVLLCLTFMFGGSSRGGELPVMMMELVGIALLAVSLPRVLLTGMGRANRVPIALLFAALLTPVLQLTPVPPQIWQVLPGRAEAVETLGLVGLSSGWAPLTLTPEATYRSLLWMLPPAAMFVATLGMRARHRLWVLGLVLVLCAVGLALAGLQLSDRQGGGFQIHDTSHAGLPVGFFANRNHQGVLMAAALPVAAAFAAAWGARVSHRRKPASLVYAGLVGLLAVGILVTRSRSALVLAGPAVIASFAIFWTALDDKSRRRERALAVGAAAIFLVIAAQVAIVAVLNRFEDVADREGRFDIWPIVLAEGAKAQPWGTGLGSFEDVYRSAEPITLITPLYVNHAHNDYLELWMETGVLLQAVLAAFVAWLAAAALRAWRAPSSSAERAIARAGSVVIAVLLLHSIGDYPLRTQALACLFALAAGCLTPAPAEAGGSGAPVRARR